MSDDFKKSSDRQDQKVIPIEYDKPWQQVSSDPYAVNNFISGLGLKMQHWAYTPYIIGATNTGNIRNYNEQVVKKPNDEFLYDNNGVYKYMGDVHVIWQSNNKQLVQMPLGYYPESSATVTINRCYIGTNKIVGLSEFDKLVPVIETDPIEYASVNWEQINHNPSGIDRTMFKIVKVDVIVDANGIEYEEGIDYIIEKGDIKWLPQGKRPGFDNLSGEGVVLAIRYRYIPSFYIKYAAHELRSHVQIDKITGLPKPIRGPMTALVQIDWVFLQSLKNQEKDGDTAKNFGDGGNLGPR